MPTLFGRSGRRHSTHRRCSPRRPKSGHEKKKPRTVRLAAPIRVGSFSNETS